MNLVEKKIVNKSMIQTTPRIYINTLIPYFEFKNKLGRTVMPIKRCISL
tara:strand:+ start:29825 stop:29971 length:147 start_codon:yes stop_codon:yes gene_type:complete